MTEKSAEKKCRITQWNEAIAKATEALGALIDLQDEINGSDEIDDLNFRLALDIVQEASAIDYPTE